MKNNKKVLVVISVILILVIAGAVFAYLYIATDTFKSNKELFAKYFGQNEEILHKIIDLKTIEVYKNLKDESKYESNTNVKISYSEGGEISNPLNNLTVKLDVQKDNEEQYTYIDGQILYEDEEYLETELIKEKNVYGIRFTDAIQQFIAVENDKIMSNLGLSNEQTEELINSFEKQTNNNEKIIALKNKYLNIITSGIANGEFSKQKNAVITYDNNTTNTNSYSVLLSSEQVKNILIEILNNVKNETELLQNIKNKDDFIKAIDKTIENISREFEIPQIKIKVYEYKRNTIKTVFEMGGYNVSIENVEQNQELKTKINYSNLSGEKSVETEIEIIRTNYENKEKFEVTANIIEDDNQYTITFSNIMQLSQEQIRANIEIGYKQDITMISLIMENDVKIGQDFEKRQTLEKENSKLISSLEEQKRNEMINIIKGIVIQKADERINLLKEKLEMNKNENVEEENEISQAEINKFNAKFEFYTGEEVSAENVKMLLDVVKNNISGYEFIETENPEDTESGISKTDKVSIKLNIEKDKVDEEGINKILEKINTNKKYKVSINYKESNGLIEYINITEI